MKVLTKFINSYLYDPSTNFITEFEGLCSEVYTFSNRKTTERCKVSYHQGKFVTRARLPICYLIILIKMHLTTQHLKCQIRLDSELDYLNPVQCSGGVERAWFNWPKLNTRRHRSYTLVSIWLRPRPWSDSPKFANSSPGGKGGPESGELYGSIGAMMGRSGGGPG